MKEFKDNDIVQVWNNLKWSVSYVTDKTVRTWQAPGSYKKIQFGELVEAVTYRGNRVLFEEGALLIKDNEVRERLDLPLLDKYVLDLSEMKKLLESGDADKIEDFVQYCSNMMLETFIQVAIELPIQDMKIAKILGSYTQVDILGAIEERSEMSQDDSKTQSPEKDKPRHKRIPKE